MRKQLARYYPLLTPLFAFLAWPPLGLAPFIFVCFVPLLFFSEKRRKTLSRFLIVYICLLIWNLSVTHWIFNTSLMGGLLVHLLNPIILSIPFLVFSWTWQNRYLKYLAFISCWLCLEYLHFNWQLGFPFLTLGYSISQYPILFQFYEYTGVFGGSLWILIANIIIYHLLTVPDFSILRKVAISTIIVLPIIASLLLLENPVPTDTIRYRSLQTNVDCRSEKYSVPTSTLVNQYIDRSLESLDADTELLIWPETAITSLETIELIDYNEISDLIYSRLLAEEYPKLRLVSGAIVYDILKNKKRSELVHMPNATYNQQGSFWYLTYNAAIQFDYNNPSQLRTKEKLVPVEETIPFSSQFKFLRKLVSSLGGFSFSYLPTSNLFGIGEHQYSALICYESLFGEYIGDLANKGANFFVVISNEGWFKSKKGAAQFLYYTSTKAVETRREIVKSSNQGSTAHINRKGEILQIENDFKSATISGDISLFDDTTFYAIYGDYIGKASTVLFLALFGILLSRSIKSRFSKR